MTSDRPTISSIRKIDNSRQWLPIITTFLLIFLIVLFVWFLKGGSFRLYASIFFTLYNLTHQIWVSVLLMGVVQNLAFLPLRLIGNLADQPLKDFEDELDQMNQSEQFLVFSKKVKEGSLPIVFYIFNFFVNAIAFFSAGRIFLIDFYSKKLDPHLLYHFVKYPEYPLKGTIFHFPFFKVTDTIAIPWSTIFLYIGGLLLFLTILRLGWRLVRFLLWKSKKILQLRIGYNRLMLFLSSFTGVFSILLIVLLRHLPVSFAGLMFNINLTRQNTPMNFVTAVGTFITTLHANYKNAQIASHKAKLANIPEAIIKRVFKEKMKQGVQNAFVLGLGAFLITNNIPSAFELSVATFEVLYMVYPYTFGLIIRSGSKKVNKVNVVPSA